MARNVGAVRLRGSPASATKAFTSHVVVLTLFTVRMGRLRGNPGPEHRRGILDALAQLPEKVDQVLELNDAIRELPRTYKGATNFLYLGRG